MHSSYFAGDIPTTGIAENLMQIAPSTIKQAIHRILRERRLRIGSCITLDHLRLEWMGTGLRDSDLIDGLNMLRDERYVSLRDEHTECVVTILRRQPLMQPLALNELATLSRVGKRRRCGVSGIERRKEPIF